MLISELLDDHREALKEKDGEVADLHRRMEEFSAAEKVVNGRSVGSEQIWTTKWWFIQIGRS